MPSAASCRRSYSTTPSAGDRCSPIPAKISTRRSNWTGTSWSPEHCWWARRTTSREKIQELQEVCNLGYLLVEFAHSGIPQRKILRNLENFATKVMPRFAH